MTKNKIQNGVYQKILFHTWLQWCGQSLSFIINLTWKKKSTFTYGDLIHVEEKKI